MVSAAVQRIESLLRAKRLDGTLTRPDGSGISCISNFETGPGAASSGHPDFDRALGGGWRRGEVSEIVGPSSSGRTSVCVATLSAAVRRGEVVAVVDACDQFDPRAAEMAGLDVSQVLWVRGPELTFVAARAPMVARVARQAIRAFDLILRAGGFGVVVLDIADVPARELRHMPMTTWLRLAHANEGRDTVGLILAASPLGRSARGASVRVSADARWAGVSDRSRRLEGLNVHADVLRAAVAVGEPVTLRL